ncbi:outer membrane protein [Sphingomonas adhaesiva]|uniref:outer membrane protein n=1 Tax=Sphingomonas adhaesiva TaxID=28212 RepID=UPI002FFA36BA
MMKKLIWTAAAVASTLFAGAAAAQDAADVQGAYVELRGGIASVKNVDVGYFDAGGTFGGTGTRDTATFDVDFKDAFAFGGTIGYDFGMIRADVQVDYARNRTKQFTLRAINNQAVTITPAIRQDVCDYLDTTACGGSGNSFTYEDDHLRQLSALANLWLDIPTGSIVTPYVGGGAGLAGYELGGEGKARFAWQLGAGVSVDLNRSVALAIDYRRRQTNGATITDEDSSNAGVTIGKVKTDTISAGLRFRF